MKTIIIFLCVFILITMVVQADVYVKGTQNVETRYHHGSLYPEYDMVHEWWFGKNKLTFIRHEFRNFEGFLIVPAMRITLDKERKHITVINLSEKTFVKIHLQMDLSSHIDQSLVERLNNYQINGIIKKTGKKKTIHQKVCEVYTVSEWIIFQKERFYDRERTIMVTSDVPFNWQIVNELYQWIRSFFNPQKSYLLELKNLKGFLMAANNIRFSSGKQLKSSFRILKICQKEAPKNIYDIPKDFKKKEKLTMDDLIGMRGMLYLREW